MEGEQQQFVGVNPDEVVKAVGEMSNTMRQNERGNAERVLADLERQLKEKSAMQDAALRAGDNAKAAAVSGEMERIMRGVAAITPFLL